MKFAHVVVLHETAEFCAFFSTNRFGDFKDCTSDSEAMDQEQRIFLICK